MLFEYANKHGWATPQKESELSLKSNKWTYYRTVNRLLEKSATLPKVWTILSWRLELGLTVNSRRNKKRQSLPRTSESICPLLSQTEVKIIKQLSEASNEKLRRHLCLAEQNKWLSSPELDAQQRSDGWLVATISPLSRSKVAGRMYLPPS